MTTNIPNDTLILIDKIIKITERYSLNVANYLQWLEDNNSNDRFINRIEVETNRLIEFIGLHEELQDQFNFLLEYLKSNKQQQEEYQRAYLLAYEKYKNLELAHKDVIEYKNQITYYKKAAKLMYNELQKVKHEQQNK
jgi:hypothetical protein